MASEIVQIEKLVYGGDGLARHDGQVVLAPFVLPGERVELTTSRLKNGVLRGSSPRILETSPERVVPRCEYFADCGGCHYQHSEYSFELESKASILRETLARIGGIRYEAEIPIISADPWNYRNRIQLHFADGKLGYHKAESHDICHIGHCEISSPVLNGVIAKLRTAVKQPQWPAFLRSLEIFTNEKQVQLTVTDTARPVAARFFDWCATFMPPLVPGAIDYSAGSDIFRISRGSFFQVNRFLVDRLMDEVTGSFEGSRAVDLYAGVGLFSVPLAKRFGSVDAVERGGPAFRDLEITAGSGGNIRAMKNSAEEFLGTLSEPPDLVVADPPRAGLGREATNELIRIKPQNLTIVSCDIATLARDLKNLAATYRIRRLALVDLFPRTYHFETVAHLERA